MEYESDILKRLIDTYGVVGNPRYISEIIKEFIIQGKERYPELFTYQSDWLAHIDEFGLNPSYTVSYTGQSIYAPNTLERPVKSAILKGNTLVNLIDYTEFPYSSNIFNNDFHLKYELKTNTTYTIIVDINLNGVEPDTFGLGLLQYGVDWASNNGQYVNGLNKIKLTTNNLIANYLRIRGDGIIVNYAIVIEGDYTNVDIPYFDGIQSVKMPVLTTTGKNLFNNKLKLTNFDSSGNELSSTSHISSADYIAIEPNTQYYFSCGNGFNNTSAKCIYWYDENKNFIKQVNETGTSPSNAHYCRLRTRKDNSSVILESEFESVKMQLEKGKQATLYEPYKSNILTVNEDVELRGIGDVKDELDCLTGEMTQRIGEMILDGSETWVLGTIKEKTQVFRIPVDSDKIVDMKKGTLIMCDKLKVTSGIDDETIILSNTIYLALLKSKASTVEELKVYLSQNPITIQYQLATESVKTVDLSILDQNGQNVKQLMSFNGGTHFNTGSLEGSPLPSVSVSVETDLEETLKVCSLEGNTM